MELANLWLPVLGAGIFGAIAIGAWFADHKTAGIWFGFGAGVSLLLLGALQLQEIVTQQKDIPKPSGDRPWLSVEPRITGPLTFNENGGRIGLEFTIRNTGKSPATGVEICFEIISTTTLMAESDGEVSKRPICANVKNRPIEANTGRYVIFPKDVLIEKTNYSFSKEEITKYGALLKEKGITGNKIITQMSFVLVGCVDYLFGSDGVHHQTGFAYDLAALDPSRPGKRLLINTLSETPIDRLILTTSFIGKSYAD